MQKKAGEQRKNTEQVRQIINGRFRTKISVITLNCAKLKWAENPEKSAICGLQEIYPGYKVKQ